MEHALIILFNLAMEHAVRAIRISPGGTINNRMTQIMAYADDVLLSARTKAVLSGALQESGAATNIGLRINEKRQNI
jgi:hypothetical protein